jgi:hypothetical protein
MRKNHEYVYHTADMVIKTYKENDKFFNEYTWDCSVCNPPEPATTTLSYHSGNKIPTYYDMLCIIQYMLQDNYDLSVWKKHSMSLIIEAVKQRDQWEEG